jgi:antitoxin component of RelBE/YafQ-DinJ toxin-antitoxin module
LMGEENKPEEKLVGHKLGEGGVDLQPPAKQTTYQGEAGFVTVLDLCPRCHGIISPGDNYLRYMGRLWHLKCFDKWKGRGKIKQILERARKDGKTLSDEEVTKMAEEMGLRKSYVVQVLNEFGIQHGAVSERVKSIIDRAKSFVGKLSDEQVRTIAEEFGIRPSRVIRILKQFNIPYEAKEEKSFKDRLLELVQKYQEGDKPLGEEHIAKIAQELGMPSGLVRYWLSSFGLVQAPRAEGRKMSFIDRIWQATKECAKGGVLGPAEILELMKRLNAPSPNWVAYYLRNFEAARKCKLFHENGTLVRIDIFER